MAMMALGLIAPCRDVGTLHVDADAVRAFMSSDEWPRLLWPIRRDGAALNVDADVALGTDMKSIDAVGVSVLAS